jgi:hypothetical protein
MGARSVPPHTQDNPVAAPRVAALLKELELLGWTACWNEEIDVRLAARATGAVKNNSLRPERPYPQLKRDLLCDTPSRGNDGLPRAFC